jgi:hypothetical protein
VSVVYGASALGTNQPGHFYGGRNGIEPLAGLTSIKTRLSACFSVMRFPALRRYGFTSSYLQIKGMHFGSGNGGLSLVIWAQSGRVFVPSNSDINRSAESSEE